MSTKFQFDVFISHNHADKPRVRTLAERLRDAGLQVWFDEWIIQPGDDIYLAIERGLEASRTLVLCLSPAALGSDWVGLERSTVLFRDPANSNRRFIPLLLNDCKLPDTLQRYKYLDYRKETQVSFAQLLAGCLPPDRAEVVSVASHPPSKLASKGMQEIGKHWRQADESARQKQPPGMKLVRTLRGHTGSIGCIAWSPDGQVLASPSADGTIRLWDAETGRLLRILEGHKSRVYSVAFDTTGRTIASGSEDETVKLWATQSGKLLNTLYGHTNAVMTVAFGKQLPILASGSKDKTVKVWDMESHRLFHTLEGQRGWVNSLNFDPESDILAVACGDKTVKLWDALNGRLIGTLEGHSDHVLSIAYESTRMLASGSGDRTVKLWEPRAPRLLHTLEGHVASVLCVAFEPQQRLLATKAESVRLWNSETGVCLAVLDLGVAVDQRLSAYQTLPQSIFRKDAQNRFTFVNSQFCKILGKKPSEILGKSDWNLNPQGLASGYQSDDHLVLSTGTSSETREEYIPLGRKHAVLMQIVRTPLFGERGEVIGLEGVINGVTERTNILQHYAAGMAFNPCQPLLAVVGTDFGAPAEQSDCVIHVYKIDFTVLHNQIAEQSTRYVNAKVVLVGDTGVGKSGLSLVLNNQPFEATDSTPGRRVWVFGSREVKAGNTITQTQETLLWDLAGQPGYRVIHQLHLNEVAVALVVFDARSETDPLAGVRHWERALRLAQQRQGTSALPMKKFLVSARNDRGGVSIGEERLQAIIKEFGFDGYFKTSAKEGWEIKELQAAIEQAINWENLPEVSSSQLFADIKAFLLEVKKTGRLLAPASQLYEEFARQHPNAEATVTNLRDQFATCIGQLENRDLIRRLTFGGYVLLQPELLDAYASAMVNTAKEEPDGLGSLSEEIALIGKFFVPKEQKITDVGQEQLLLHSTVEELVRHDLALREIADDGRYLVFPSQFNRDYEDAPEPKGKAVAITFDGPVQSLYSSLAVRLGHSGMFTTGRAEMWRNAAVFAAKAGGKCGLYLHEFAEGRGRLILFFPDEQSSAETRFHFEEFVLAHAKRRALDGTVELVRFFVCPNCGDPVPDSYVKRLREKGKFEFSCPCGGTVSLAEPQERIHFGSKVEAMEQSADRQRDFDAFVLSAKGETNTRSFQEWAGGEQVTLAIVFTDIVGSTALSEEIRDEAMNVVRRAHFAQSRRLIGQFQGIEIKTIGDSFMAAFKSVGAALDYAQALQKRTGHPQVRIRAGIHIGPIRVEEGDVFGGTVNFAARVIDAIEDAEIWLSDRAKDDIDRLGAAKHKELNWERHEGMIFKGFPGKFTLWSVQTSSQ